MCCQSTLKLFSVYPTERRTRMPIAEYDHVILNPKPDSRKGGIETVGKKVAITIF